jgi:hypothetical protein
VIRFVDDLSGLQIPFEVRDVVLAGYTGRDQEAVRQHVAELAAHGVPAPERVPAFYRVSPDRLVGTSRLGVLGSSTSGEGEFVLFRAGGTQYLGVGSDHTDRHTERDSVRLAKQLCAKVAGTRVWPLAHAAAHWDHLELRSFAGDRAAARPYQRGPVTALLDPQEIWQRALARIGAGTEPGGLLVFCGTLPLLSELAFDRRFAVELADDACGQTLRLEYEVDAAEPLD